MGSESLSFRRIHSTYFSPIYHSWVFWRVRSSHSLHFFLSMSCLAFHHSFSFLFQLLFLTRKSFNFQKDAFVLGVRPLWIVTVHINSNQDKSQGKYHSLHIHCNVKSLVSVHPRKTAISNILLIQKDGKKGLGSECTVKPHVQPLPSDWLGRCQTRVESWRELTKGLGPESGFLTAENETRYSKVVY